MTPLVSLGHSHSQSTFRRSTTYTNNLTPSKNVLNTRMWETRQELATAIRHWIESTYHRRRRQARLGKLTPIEYETIYTN